MAVAHSAASESHTGSTGSANQAAFSWTHTQTGTPRGVIVFVSTYASVADLITSVTYGGLALTRLAGGAALDNAGELGRLDAFFLGSGLGTGNQTITVNRTNNATVMYAAAATVTAGADTAVPTQTIVLLQGDGTLTVQSVNDTSPGQNSVRYAGSYSGLGSPPPAGTGSTLLNSIDIGAYGSALVRETTAGQGARNVGFNSATTDDRAVVHLAIRELVPRSLPQTAASFTLTGNDATLTKTGGLNNYTLPVDVGAFAFTGRTADLRHNPDLEAGTGTYALTGPPATTRHNVRIEGGTGAFSLTGNDATLAKSAAVKVITADRGQFTLTGNAATLRQNYTIAAGVGTFTVAGQAATLRHNPQILGATGTFSLTGQPATLRQNYRLTAEVGTFTATGQPATLRHNPRIEAARGSFALTGGAPALLRGRYLSGGSGTFTETGQPATFRRTWAIRPTAGTFVLTGITPALSEIGAYEIDPIVGSFNFNGQDATLLHNPRIDFVVGQFTLNGNQAAFQQNYLASATVGAFALAGGQPQLRQNYSLSANTGSFLESAGPANRAHSQKIVANTGAFVFTGNDAALVEIRAFAIDAGTGTFALSGKSVALASSKKIAASSGNFVITGNSVGLSKARNVVINADRGVFVVSGKNAGLTRNRNIIALAGQFTVSGNNVNLSRALLLNAGTGSIIFNGLDASLQKIAALALPADLASFSLVGRDAMLAKSSPRRRNVLIF